MIEIKIKIKIEIEIKIYQDLLISLSEQYKL